MISEKVSVNINEEALSKIDLLVEDGFYSNRSDFINRAVDTLLDRENRTVDKLLEIHSKEKINSRQWFVGVQTMGSQYLEKVKEQGVRLRIKGCGVLYFEKDAAKELVFETVEYISSRIRVIAEDEIREHYKAPRKSGIRRRAQSKKD